MRFSSDCRRVVYSSDQETPEQFELYSVPIASGPSTLLNPPLAPDRDVISWNFQIALNGRVAVYIADQDADEVYELYAAFDDGSAPSATPTPRATVTPGDTQPTATPGPQQGHGIALPLVVAGAPDGPDSPGGPDQPQSGNNAHGREYASR
jgi:hypothetical protein